MAKSGTHPHGDRVHDLVRRGWLTNQHGAWAMMIVPLLVGSLLSGLNWRQAVLSISWVAAFFFFGALSLYVKVLSSTRSRALARGNAVRDALTSPGVRRRLGRYHAALLTYGSVSVVGATALLVLRPCLLWWAIPIGACFAVALWQMWLGKDRSLLARGSAIVASQLMAPISYSLGTSQTDWPRTWFATVVLALYFIGTIPFVKALIRERNNRAWLYGSLAYHTVLVVIAFLGAAMHLLSWWVLGLSAVLLLRAILFPVWSLRAGRAVRPAVLGITEFFVSAAVVLVLLLPGN